MQTLTLSGVRHTQRLVAYVIAAVALAVLVTIAAVHWADSGAGAGPAPIRTTPASSHMAVPPAPAQPRPVCGPHHPC